VADDARTPVAIRISRPFASEEEFLAHELDTLTRTTVMLVGAQSRPQGVVLRFEVALASGDPLIRGEGRVVGFRAASHGLDSGLTLRFTRLDARSKALVDRAAAMRETRARASHYPPRPPVEAAVPIPPPPPPPAPPRPPPPSDPTLMVTHLPRELDPSTQPSLEEPPPIPVAAAPSSVNVRRGVPPPPPSSGTAKLNGTRREELLDRLRQRAKTLSPSAVATLLASRKRA
jgi:molecular chaperone DnaK